MQVAQQGEAILTLRAQEISAEEFSSLWLKAVIAEMYDTMQARQGVGIAAPQVYLSKRIIIVASRANSRYPDAPNLPPVTMLNPVIIARSDDMLLGEEGCLSVPLQRGQVARSASIQVRYADIDGAIHTAEYQGFPARIVQHEIDHLDGILFTQRLTESI